MFCITACSSISCTSFTSARERPRHGLASTAASRARVSFAAFASTDETGSQKLGAARAIGAVWPRKNGKGGILRFDHIPVELTRSQGVIFISTIETGAS